MSFIFSGEWLLNSQKTLSCLIAIYNYNFFNIGDRNRRDSSGKFGTTVEVLKDAYITADVISRAATITQCQQQQISVQLPISTGTGSSFYWCTEIRGFSLSENNKSYQGKTSKEHQSLSTVSSVPPSNHIEILSRHWRGLNWQSQTNSIEWSRSLQSPSLWTAGEAAAVDDDHQTSKWYQDDQSK